MCRHLMHELPFEWIDSRFEYLFWQSARHLRVNGVYRIAIPTTVELLLANSSATPRVIAQFQCKSISAFISQRRCVFDGISHAALFVKVSGPDMQRLMNICDVMGKENDRNGLCDLSLVLVGDSPLQDIDAERNHVHNVPFAATNGALAVSLRGHHRDIGIVKPMVRRRIGIVRWLVRAPEITELPVDVAMSGVMKRSRIVGSFFVPALNFICN